MASVYTKLPTGPKPYFVIILFFLMSIGCKPRPKVYESDCDEGQTFVRVNFTHLLDSMAYYDQKYIETTGIYREGKEKSSLYNDSVKPDNKALWVNFSQDCELYLTGTHIGLFDYNNGSFTQLNNKKVRIRGKVDMHNLGHLKLYKGCIDRVSLVEL